MCRQLVGWVTTSECLLLIAKRCENATSHSMHIITIHHIIRAMLPLLLLRWKFAHPSAHRIRPGSSHPALVYARDKELGQAVCPQRHDVQVPTAVHKTSSQSETSKLLQEKAKGLDHRWKGGHPEMEALANIIRNGHLCVEFDAIPGTTMITTKTCNKSKYKLEKTHDLAFDSPGLLQTQVLRRAMYRKAVGVEPDL